METKVISSPNFICSHYILILFMFGWTLVGIKDLLFSLLGSVFKSISMENR
jgi:hypothetical protein